MDISFSGAGFMGCYYFGVVDCWNKYVPKERVNRAAGASAGSLIAAYYLLELPLSTCIREIIQLTEDIRRRPLGVFDRSHQIVDVLPKLLDRLFPDDAHKIVSGRLHVCMTRLKDMKKVIVNQFDTKKDLIDALNCSCFIPVWSGNHVSTYQGVKHIDGGFSDNLPVFDDNTIRVCCFSGASDISPYDRAKVELLSTSVLNTPLYLNIANCRRFRKALFPPPAGYIVDLLERGFHDTKSFILTNDLIQCDGCFSRAAPVFRGPAPTITPSHSPGVSRSGSVRVWRLAPTGVSAQQLGDRLQAHTPPCIMVDEHADSAVELSSESSAGSPSPPSATTPQRFVPVLRRNTLATTSPNLLVVEERFQPAPSPLPSCPPSPNLNRHCDQCIRMRQEARADHLEEDILHEAQKYRTPVSPEPKLKQKLAKPIRWLRQIGLKSSYKL